MVSVLNSLSVLLMFYITVKKKRVLLLYRLSLIATTKCSTSYQVTSLFSYVTLFPKIYIKNLQSNHASINYKLHLYRSLYRLELDLIYKSYR